LAESENYLDTERKIIPIILEKPFHLIGRF